VDQQKKRRNEPNLLQTRNSNQTKNKSDEICLDE